MCWSHHDLSSGLHALADVVQCWRIHLRIFSFPGILRYRSECRPYSNSHEFNIASCLVLFSVCFSGNVSVSTLVRRASRSAMHAGSCTVWSTASSPTDRCRVTRREVEEMIPSTRSSARRAPANTFHAPSTSTSNQPLSVRLLIGPPTVQLLLQKDNCKLKARQFGSWVRILVEPLRNFGDSVYSNLPVSFGETLKAVGRLYLVSMPGEVKYPTQGKMCNLPWTPQLWNNHSYVNPTMGCSYTHLIYMFVSTLAAIFHNQKNRHVLETRQIGLQENDLLASGDVAVCVFSCLYEVATFPWALIQHHLTLVCFLAIR